MVLQINLLNDITKSLEGAKYPAGKQDLLNFAKEGGANEDIQKAIDDLPDQIFNTAEDLNEALSKNLNTED